MQSGFKVFSLWHGYIIVWMAKVTPWTDPRLPEAVEYDSDELERIRRRTIDGLLSLPRIGMGVGGLLLGTRESGVIRILGSRKIACAHAFGPGFRLTAEEIAAADSGALRTNGLQVVGWYGSKPRGKAELSEDDEKLFDRLCPLPWQIALIVLPSTVEATRAAVFTRNGEGGALLPLRELKSEPKLPYAAPPTPQISPPKPPTPITPRPPAVLTIPAQPLFAAPPSAPPALSVPRWAVAAALCLFAAWGVFASRDRWLPQPKLELRSFDSGNALTIEWNTKAVKGTGGGSLEIRDGVESRTYLLNEAQLRAGTMSYPRKTGKVSARLRAGRIEDSATFTGPPPTPMKR